jgi:antirestriction protein ArdC
VVFWKFADGRAEGQDEGEQEQVSPRSHLLFCREYHVFNAAQVDGYTPKDDAETPIEQRIESAEVFFQRISARVVHQGNRAFCTPADDTITLPPFAAFFTPTDYYSTRAHETGHWTGHAWRCNRELGKRFGDNAYSVEELIAELTAAFVCAHLGLSSSPRPDHAQYIASWLRVLKADKRAIFAAASKAQQAADYLVTAAERTAEVAKGAAA